MSLEEYEAWRAKQSGYPGVPHVESIWEKERKELAALSSSNSINDQNGGLEFTTEHAASKKEISESLNKLWKDTTRI